MFSSDKSKQKKRCSVETNVSHASTEKPIHQGESRIRKGRSHPNLLTIPLHSPGSVQNTAVNHDTDEKPDYQNTSYTDKLSIAIQMVPNLLAGDVKQTLEKLLHDPTFTAELVAVGAVFAGLQATPAGPFIDAAMVATLGIDVALKLGGFLYKSYTAHNENDLKEAAVDLKGFVEVAGLVGATKLLGMAGRALKKLSGEATAVEGQAIPRLSDDEAAKIWGAGPGKAPQSKPSAREAHKAQSSKQRAANTTSQADRPLEPVNPRKASHGHGHADHGHQTTSAQQGHRIRTGVTPSGRIGKPTSKASSFHSPEAEAEALGKARTRLNKDIQSGVTPKYDANGEPNRFMIDNITTNRKDGFGYQVVKQKDSNGQVVRDASGLPLTTTDPTPLTKAKVLFEYVPSKDRWEPVTYFPER